MGQIRRICYQPLLSKNFVLAELVTLRHRYSKQLNTIPCLRPATSNLAM